MQQRVELFTGDTSNSIDFHDVTRILDPITLQINRSNKDEYFTMSKVSSDKLLRCLNMKGLPFNKQLFELSPDVWKNLLDYSLSQIDEKEWRSFTGLVFDNQVASITSGNSNYPKLLDILDKCIENSDKSYSSIKDDVLYLYSFNKDNNGILVRYYFNYNWITINYSRKTDDSLLIFDFKEYDGGVSDDIDSIISPSTYISSANELTDKLYTDYSELSTAPISVNEFTSIIKKFFKLKLTLETVDIYDYLLNTGKWIPEEYSKDFVQLINKFNTDKSRSLITSTWLKKSVAFTDVTWDDLIKLLSSLVWNGLISFDDFISLESTIMTRRTNYSMLNS